ncbi:aspartate carbamoyltransferase [Anaerofustis stercorihominis]|uniref:Aspartate carbamoyltransferase n=2 Tax=Anaerofustis stercorihominis TaxID=214853 RepID=B1C952_9FIRM|nr:aspartate carbamoyltransferase [Anaerofustis stercorihominis]EDS72216.1 aspartate carbamoyltransferase [Anaerofustis stercorihominis DSM 17244]MCQ4795183.1 aspartate carbamoyltransferase [Anaerofustis stercorihominis]RGD73241.1 aspartate carbamoyltransferase [Anaerofustis stercorihominis]
MLKGRDLIEPTNFTVEELDEIFALANDILNDEKKYVDVCHGKLLASLFYEPSTRTKFSFDAAMYRLGGNVLGFSDPNTSSTSKGESLADTTVVVSNYVDIIVARHPREGTAKLMSEHSRVPVINAGDGGHQHPTQTLTDLLTIQYYKHDFNNLKIGVCGDLMFGRTIHSLVKAMSRYENIEFVFISPKELSMPEYIKEEIEGKAKYSETNSLDEVIGDLDVLYMSRVQRERFVNEEEYLRLKDYFILTKEKLEKAKEDMIVMHPLPRVNEISTDVDDDKRAVYFMQGRLGMYVRMALIMKLLGVEVDD